MLKRDKMKCFYKGKCPFWYHGCEHHDLDKCELNKDFVGV